MRGFAARLGLVAAVAALVRLVHLLAVAPHTAGIEDGFWFHTVAQSIADGHGFARPTGSFFAPGFHVVPTATHPPLYPLLLAAADKLGITGDEGQRALGVGLGALTVAGVGLVGRRVAGERVALVAALLAAFSPLLIAADGALLAETLYAPLVVFTLLAALRLLERPSARRAALVGLGIGLAALTRGEAVLLLPLLAIPLAWRGGRPGRWLRLGAAVACAVLVVAPWVARNWSTFDRPFIADDIDELVAITNCHAAYHRPQIGFSVPECKSVEHGSEQQANDRWRHEGFSYMGAHAGRLAIVMPVRVLRLWSIYAPFQHAQEQGRSQNVQKLGIVYDWLVCALAIAGAWLLRRRRGRLLVLLAPIALVTIAAALTFGAARLRDAAEPSLCVLAAAALVSVAQRWIPRSAPSASSSS